MTQTCVLYQAKVDELLPTVKLTLPEDGPPLQNLVPGAAEAAAAAAADS